MTNKILLGMTIAAISGMLIAFSMGSQNEALSQEMDKPETVIDTETISLTGKLAPGDFKLLMDITGYLSKDGHVAMKVPCGPDGEALLAIVAGVAPDVAPIDMDYVAPLSNPPASCVFHGEVPEGITDIALINTSDDRVKFFGKSSAGYSVTITIHGEAGGEHGEHE